MKARRDRYSPPPSPHRSPFGCAPARERAGAPPPPPPAPPPLTPTRAQPDGSKSSPGPTMWPGRSGTPESSPMPSARPSRPGGQPSLRPHEAEVEQRGQCNREGDPDDDLGPEEGVQPAQDEEAVAPEPQNRGHGHQPDRGH